MDERTKKAIKEYLKLDLEDTEEDHIIESLYKAALSLIETQTGKKISNIPSEAEDNKELYLLAIKLLISHWHENRAVTVTGATISEIPLSASLIINHIALCGDFV